MDYAGPGHNHVARLNQVPRVLNDKLALPLPPDQAHFKERMSVQPVICEVLFISPVQDFHRPRPQRNPPPIPV